MVSCCHPFLRTLDCYECVTEKQLLFFGLVDIRPTLRTVLTDQRFQPITMVPRSAIATMVMLVFPFLLTFELLLNLARLFRVLIFAHPQLL